jgi:hypothetical protein
MEYILVSLIGAVLVELAFRDDNLWDEWKDDDWT